MFLPFFENIGVWRGVSKGVEDGRRLPALWDHGWATSETAIRQGIEE
jgi:hypothetical protein